MQGRSRLGGPAGWVQVRSLWSGSGKDFSFLWMWCGTGLKFVGWEQTKKFNLRRTLLHMSFEIHGPGLNVC